MCVYIYIYIYIYTYVNLYTHIYVCVCVAGWRSSAGLEMWASTPAKKKKSGI